MKHPVVPPLAQTIPIPPEKPAPICGAKTDEVKSAGSWNLGALPTPAGPTS